MLELPKSPQNWSDAMKRFSDNGLVYEAQRQLYGNSILDILQSSADEYRPYKEDVIGNFDLGLQRTFANRITGSGLLAGDQIDRRIWTMLASRIAEDQCYRLLATKCHELLSLQTDEDYASLEYEFNWSLLFGEYDQSYNNIFHYLPLMIDYAKETQNTNRARLPLIIELPEVTSDFDYLARYCIAMQYAIFEHTSLLSDQRDNQLLSRMLLLDKQSKSQKILAKLLVSKLIKSPNSCPATELNKELFNGDWHSLAYLKFFYWRYQLDSIGNCQFDSKHNAKVIFLADRLSYQYIESKHHFMRGGPGRNGSTLAFGSYPWFPYIKDQKPTNALFSNEYNSFTQKHNLDNLNPERLQNIETNLREIAGYHHT